MSSQNAEIGATTQHELAVTICICTGGHDPERRVECRYAERAAGQVVAAGWRPPEDDEATRCRCGRFPRHTQPPVGTLQPEQERSMTAESTRGGGPEYTPDPEQKRIAHQAAGHDLGPTIPQTYPTNGEIYDVRYCECGLEFILARPSATVAAIRPGISDGSAS